MVEQMAHRYGMLPSEMLARGTTQDVFMFDIYTTYQNHVNEKQRKQHDRKASPASQAVTPASAELLERYNKFKEKNS
jgi:hypothetical protein